MLSLLNNFIGAFKSWIIVFILLAIMGGAVYFYYNSTQHTILQLTSANAILKQNELQLKQANQENLNTIDTLNKNFAQVQKDYTDLTSTFQIIRSQNVDMQDKIKRHNLALLAESKPNLLEPLINNASVKSLRCFELLSGAPLTEKEKNAKNSTEFNSECPSLFITLVKH